MHGRQILVAVFIGGLLMGLTIGLGAANVFSDRPEPMMAGGQRGPSISQAGGPADEPGLVAKDDSGDSVGAGADTLEVGCEAEAARVDKLRAEMDKLRRQVAFEKAFREDLQGTPTPFPESVADRFQKEYFAAQIKKSIAATGIDGLVENVDCEEFPCIVYGVISSDISSEAALADLRLLHEQTQKHYKGDNFYISHTTEEPKAGEEGDPVVVFNISYYPDDLPDAEDNALGKRLKYRKDRYFDALQ